MKSADSTFHAEPWIDDVYSSSTKERIASAEELLSTLNADSEAASLNSALADPKEFIKLQFSPYIYYVPMNETLENRVRHIKFKTPTISLKHKRLPLLVGASYEIGDGGSVVPIDYVKDFPPNIRQILAYANTVSRMSKNEKNRLKELIIDGIRTYRKGSEKKSEWLSDYVESGRDFEILGFALNHSYINVDPGYGDTKPLWIHPWGTPSLLLKHKRLPYFMVTGPSIRLDENVRGEKNMLGWTG